VGERSTEVVPALAADEKPSPARRYYVDTLEQPNIISIDAAEQRADVATRANVLSPALDAAVSAGARNSIERMLSHQLAAIHFAGMDSLARLEQTFVNLPPVERVRLMNAAARMFEVYQSGCLTLQKLKTRGRQPVIVQHVNVGPGGQAVVAGRVDRGSRKRGAPPRTGDEPHDRESPGPEERQPAGRSLDGAAVRGEDATWNSLPLSGDAKASTLSPARREEHGAANARVSSGAGARAGGTGCARVVCESFSRRTADRSSSSSRCSTRSRRGHSTRMTH
jgi:hypothetical protein